MTQPLVLPLPQCTDLQLVGGKAVGLARLLASGFPVPPGICVTTEAYNEGLTLSGIDPKEDWRKVCALSVTARVAALSDYQMRIRQVDCSRFATQWLDAIRAIDAMSGTRWAVRSSATNEDTGQTSFAGLYRTQLGIAINRIDSALKDLWASLWQERVMQYMIERGLSGVTPSMAVVIQPMLDAVVSGVAYSIHPVTGRSCSVTINAVPGLAAPLVDGQVAPDHYVVETDSDHQPVWVRRKAIAVKSSRLTVAEEGLRQEILQEAQQRQSSLSDEQLCELVRMAKKVEQAFGHPIDMEWTIDALKLWVLQARPITAVRPSSALTDDDCEWSRANFKETMPELPSPLGLSFLEDFMRDHIVEPYRRLGCHIPDGVSPTRILYGRPYLNVTLFHVLVAQLRGDPTLLPEQMGGEPIKAAHNVQPLGWLAFVRAGIVMLKEMRRATVYGASWFSHMKEMAGQCNAEYVATLSFQDTIHRLDKLHRWFQTHELTFGITGGVSQCLQVLSTVLPRWLGEDWRELSNAALQGQGTVISAEQILRLAAITDIARHEPATETFFKTEPWDSSSFRTTLKNTAFLRRFQAYVNDYGHRGIGESDVMSPRLEENPEAILAVIRAQLGSSSPGIEEIRSRQEQIRTDALAEIKRRMGWRLHRWYAYRWCYRRLCRFFALREANRHHVMYFSAATRKLLLHLGDLLVAQGVCDTRDDIFFLTTTEHTDLVAEKTRDWRPLIRARRLEREHHAAIGVPDMIHDWETVRTGSMTTACDDEPSLLSGFPISIGTVSGPVRLLRSPADWSKVAPGDIIVTPVIDPGMAPLFGMAGGLIAEMGGTLSHGAIIAREFGLPTVANVEGAMIRLTEGQVVEMDAGAGTIRLETQSFGAPDR